MAALQEVIIGNLRLSIVAGPSPRDREMVIQGSATLYDQNVNATRSYVGDLTDKLTAQEQDMCEDLMARLIQGLMTEYDITQADLNEGQAILDAAAQNPQPGMMMAPTPPPPPAPAPMMAAPVAVTVVAPGTGIQHAEGTLAPPTTPVPSEPVSTETGEGELHTPPPEEGEPA